MIRVKPRDGFKVEYTKLFSLGWSPFINSFLASDYMHNLMVFLHEIYNFTTGNKNKIPFPLYQDLFENFRACSFLDTKVVILGKEPFPNLNATGIPFGNPVSGKGPSEVDSILLKKCIDNYKKQNKEQVNYFDETMYSWSAQGVLMLDASSTATKEKDNSHMLYWRNFTREIISILSDKKSHVVFLLLGKEASYFNKYIDKDKHKVFTYCHPSDMAKQNKKWNCPYFAKINEHLEEKYGKRSIIYW